MAPRAGTRVSKRNTVRKGEERSAADAPRAGEAWPSTVTLADDTAREYLRDFPFLAPLIRRIAEKVRDYFGESATITLDVFTFSDTEDDRELFALISSPFDAAEAHRRLAALDEEWWGAALPEAANRLTIDLVGDDLCPSSTIAATPAG